MTSEIGEGRLFELRDEAEWSLRMGYKTLVLPNKELISLINEVIFRRLKDEEMQRDEEYLDTSGY